MPTLRGTDHTELHSAFRRIHRERVLECSRTFKSGLFLVFDEMLEDHAGAGRIQLSEGIYLQSERGIVERGPAQSDGQACLYIWCMCDK